MCLSSLSSIFWWLLAQETWLPFNCINFFIKILSSNIPYLSHSIAHAGIFTMFSYRFLFYDSLYRALKKMHEVPLIHNQRKHVTCSPNHHVRYSVLSTRKSLQTPTLFLLGTFQIVCPFKNEIELLIVQTLYRDHSFHTGY